jgi:alpha-ketoglutarate-dependent taurine dioxygenase
MAGREFVTVDPDADPPQVAAEVLGGLRRYPHWVVVRDPGAVRGAAGLDRLARLLGEPVQPYPDPAYRPVREMRPADDVPVAGPQIPTESLHTDSTNWPTPNDVTLLSCVRPDDAGGGASLVLEVDDGLRSLRGELGPGAVTRLRREGLPWPVDERLGGGLTWRPAAADDRFRWQASRISEAVAVRGARVAADTVDFMTAVDRVFRASPAVRRFRLSEGDLLVTDNRRTLHAREPVPDPGRSGRRMLHCRLNLRTG